MKNKTNIIVAISALLIYFLYSSFELALLNIFNINYETLNTLSRTIFLSIMQILELVIMFALFKNQLKEAIDDLKKNHENYFKSYFKFWIYILIVMLVSNLLIILLTNKKMPANEASIRNLVVTNPFYAYFSGVIVAPILEELIFRRSLRNLIKDDTFFILVSGIIFGGLHIIIGYSGILDLLYLIPYCFPGLVFAYILTKTDNVLVPMSMHFFHNGIIISSQIFIYLFLT